MKNTLLLQLLLTVSFVSFKTNLQGQDIAPAIYYDNLNYDYLTINPAYTGAFGYGDIRVHAENGIESFDPTLFAASGNTYFDYTKLGIGGRLGYFDEDGINHLEFNSYFSYRLVLEDLEASLGVSPSLLHRSGEGMQTVGSQTGTFPINEYLPNLSAGGTLTYKDFLQVGISMPNVFSQTYWSNDKNKEIQQIRKGYFTINYIQPLNLSRSLIVNTELRIEHTNWFNQNNPDYQDISSLASLDLNLTIYQAMTFGGTAHNVTNLKDLSMDYWVNYFFRHGTRIGAALYIPKDKSTDDLSVRVVLGYSFCYKTSQILGGVRYF